MKTPNLSLTDRIRLAALRGIAKLLVRAIAPGLRPATATVSSAPGKPYEARDGRIIDGEFRRLDFQLNSRHNDRW